MNFSVISKKLTESLTEELNYCDDRKEIIAYALETTFLSMIGTIMIVCLSYSLNVLKPALIAAVFGGLLRRVSGGAHFSTPNKCLVFGTLMYSCIGVLAKTISRFAPINQNILTIVLIISLLLTTLLAPVESEAKPIHSRSLKIKLKLSSMGFILISLFLISMTTESLIKVSAVLGILYQSMTLLPIFYKAGGEKSL